ncbi:MAG: prepilin-type N-terminal cleavage/methylation domain-containing protein [Phycisphaerales bacterium]|nr:prepilin-type N-terminal cleavage/methylation domain-containing protein [Phycisphaerales bacterium]
MNTRTRRNARRGFSLIEVLIALTITATLLTATMSALDASFKGYKATSESASTQVVARIVMQRVTAMVRTGEDFGPYPINPITTPNIQSDYIEFVSFRDPSTDTERVTRLERRDTGDGSGLFELWYVVTTMVAGEEDSEDEAPLLVGLQELSFDMEYDVGPRLKRVTIDMIIDPDDLQDAQIATRLETPTIRLVASAAPRMND